MTNKIIEAARLAGGTTYTNRYYPGETACAFGPEALARFCALVRAEALEDAAKVAEARKHATPEHQLDQHYNQACGHCAQAIRSLKEQQ